MALLHHTPERVTSESALAEPVSFRSVLFAQLVAGLSVDERTVILDMGPARAANIRFFSAYRCRVIIGDMLHLLPRLATHAEAWTGSIIRHAGRAAADGVDSHDKVATPVWLEALPRDEEPADMVLAWDSCNYLSLDDYPAWVERVAQGMRPGALLHAFMATQAQLPDPPCIYDIREPQCLDRRVASGAQLGASPRYHQTELLRLMPRFEVERSVLLQDGWQEYLFRLR